MPYRDDRYSRAEDWLLSYGQLVECRGWPVLTRNSCLSPCQLVETHSRVGRIELQVEGGRFDGLLLVTGQAT
jgi:hypothetical protein